MVYRSSSRRILLAVLIVVPLVGFSSWAGWKGLETNLKDETMQIRAFEELAAYRVVNTVGFELFQLHFNFSLRIREHLDDPQTNWPQEILGMVDAYHTLARHPELLEDVVLATETGPKTVVWDWLQDRRWARSSLRPEDVPEGDGLFRQLVDPTVSLERPVLFFPLPPSSQGRRVLVVRYRVKQVTDVIVPELAAKAFSRHGTKQYQVSLVRQTSQEVSDPHLDEVVPLVPEVPFSEWLRIYLSGQSQGPDDLPIASPGFSDYRRYVPTRAHWNLQVKLLPDGRAEYSQQGQAQILVWAWVFSGLLSLGVFLFLYSFWQLRRTEKQERTFVRLVSHELKTPLAAIRSLSENLSDGFVEGPGQVRQYGTEIGQQTSRLETMVRQILTLSGVNSKAILPRPNTFDLGPLVFDVLQGMKGRVKFDASGSWWVRGNGPALHAAVDNLVTNALKYGGAEGEGLAPSVVLGRKGRWVGLSVVDHGAGLDRGERRRVLRPFYRGRRALEEQIPGSGLGLSLVKETARQAGGRLTLGPTPDGGLTATLWLREGSHGKETHPDD